MKKSKNLLFGLIILIFICLIIILIFNKDNHAKNGSLVKLSYQEVLDKVENEDDFILAVSQSTCSHCATYRPKLQEIAKDYGIDIFYIDYDTESTKNQDKFLKEFDLSGATPTTLFIKNGKEVSILSRIEGDLSESKVIAQFKKMGFIEE